MIIPSLNPLRFIKPKDNSFMANNLYSEFVTKQGLSNRSYTNIFKDRCENIYYDETLQGSYGFLNTNGWTNITGEMVVKNSILTITGATNSPSYDTTTNDKLILKIESEDYCSVVFRSGGAIIASENKIFNKNEPIIIQGVTGIIGIEFLGTASIYGVAVAPIGTAYKICDLDRVATLIDLCPKGAVYSLSSETTTDFLPTPSAGDEYSDIIRKYVIDLSPVYDDREDLTLNFNSSVSFTFGGSLDGFPVLLEDRIPQVYDFISFAYDNFNKLLIVEIAHHELLTVKMTDGTNPLIDFPVTYNSQRIDADYWYQEDGISNNFINTETASIEITGVLRAKKEGNFNSYRSYNENIHVNGSAGEVIQSIASFPSFMNTGVTDDYSAQRLNYGDDNGEVIKIKKKASIRLYATCCTFSVGDFVSEPFEIIDDKDFIDRLLTEIDYKDLEFTQGMALDVFSPSFCVDLVEEISNGNELDVFIEQERNTNLSNNQGQFRKLTTKYPIPNYLAEKLLKIFNFDTITINDINFNSTTDGTSFEKLGLYLYTFTVELRRSDYNYEVE